MNKYRLIHIIEQQRNIDRIKEIRNQRKIPQLKRNGRLLLVRILSRRQRLSDKGTSEV